MAEVMKLYNARELAEMLGLSYATAFRIMVNEMRTIQTGKNPNNPRYKVTMEEIDRWRYSRSQPHRQLSDREMRAIRAEEQKRTEKKHLVKRRPYANPKNGGIASAEG